MEASEKKYKRIFDDAILGIFQSTPEGKFVSVNPALAVILGYESPEDLLTSVVSIQDQVYAHPEDRVSFKNAIESGKVVGYEHELLRKDGATIWVSTNARAVRSLDGTVLYYEGTSVNNTEQRQAEQEKEKLQLQLRQSQKMEAVGQLSGGIAHDFNNILTVIIGYGSLLKLKLDEDDPLMFYVSQILASSERAASLIQSLLTFSRKHVMELKPHDINKIIRGAETLLRRLLAEDIELSVKLSDRAVTVMADGSQIEQVLLNLCTNARDAMPTGGQLKIEIEEADLGNELVRAHGFSKLERFVLVQVTDTGVGMNEMTREKIFEPFFTTKEAGKGTGLGLSIVYGIVKQHNGHIAVSSEAGKGTTFSIYLPAVDISKDDGRPSPRDIKGGAETILIAEDNKEVRYLTREILVQAGYTVIEAWDGDDAVRKFMGHKDAIALLLLDVVMPGKNGSRVYAEIKEIKPGIKAIFMSGYTGDVVLQKGLPGEKVDLIPKPALPDQLLLKIREVLDR